MGFFYAFFLCQFYNIHEGKRKKMSSTEKIAALKPGKIDILSVKFHAKDKAEFYGILNDVKTLRGRQFDFGTNSWNVPVSEESVRKLVEWGFSVDKTVLDLYNLGGSSSVAITKNDPRYIAEMRKRAEEKMNERIENAQLQKQHPNIPLCHNAYTNRNFKNGNEKDSNFRNRNFKNGNLKNRNLKNANPIPPLYPYQKEGVEWIEKTQGRSLIGDEMGCIEGEAILQISRAKNSKKYTLSEVHSLFPKWKESGIPTYTKAYCSGKIRHHKIKNVVFMGHRKTIQLSLKSGKKIKLTPDHEVLTLHGWKEAGKLKKGSVVLTNGKKICPICQKEKEIITYKHSKFYGWCKQCMYRYGRNNHTQNRKIIDKDGYIRVGGQYNHPRRNRSYYVYEHILVMEEFLGREITAKEAVHHIDGNKANNNIENLEVISCSEHHIKHSKYTNLNGAIDQHGNEIVFIPKEDTVVKITKSGIIPVYDIVMEDPYRNFVVNGIIVHNCGKTTQALTWTMLHPELGPFIIICPATLKINWKREVEKWTGQEAYVFNGKANFNECLEYNYIIINYDILHHHKKNIIELHPQVLIIDECHYAKNLKTKRTKNVREIGKYCKHIIALSGTPIINKPIEFYPILSLLRPDMFRSHWEYAQRFCNPEFNGFGWQYKGASNTELLNSILTKNIMIRRLKKDVLQDLPDKQQTVIPVELSNRQEYNKAEDDIIEWIRQNISDEKAARASRAIMFTKFNYLKQLAATGKMTAIQEWVDNYNDTDKKIVIFCTHHAMIDMLMEKYGPIAVKLDGRDSSNQKQRAIDLFQNNPEIKIFIGNIQAAGVGITLTASSTVLFCELGWTPGEHAQASDRCHRIGQKDSVNVYYLIAENTIEEKLMEILDSKKKILDAVLDGKETDNENILSELLKKYQKQ